MLSDIEGIRFNPDEDPYEEREQQGLVARKLRWLIPGAGPKGRLEHGSGGHSIKVDLINTDLETIPALWQERFSADWAESGHPGALVRYRELMSVDMTNSPNGHGVEVSAWLCGVLPVSPVPNPIKKRRAELVELEASRVAGAKQEAERQAAIDAKIAEHGVRVINESEECFTSGRNDFFGNDLSGYTIWYYILEAASGACYRFSDQNNMWTGERPIIPLHDAAKECSGCKIESDGSVFFTTTEQGAEVKHVLPPEELAAYLWVKKNGRGKASEGYIFSF